MPSVSPTPTIPHPTRHPGPDAARRPTRAVPHSSADFVAEPAGHGNFAPPDDADFTDFQTRALTLSEQREAALYDPRLARRILREKEAAYKRKFFMLLPIAIFLAYWTFQLYRQ
jgi:hypothetical protein